MLIKTPTISFIWMFSLINASFTKTLSMVLKNVCIQLNLILRMLSPFFLSKKTSRHGKNGSGFFLTTLYRSGYWLCRNTNEHLSMLKCLYGSSLKCGKRVGRLKLKALITQNLENLTDAVRAYTRRACIVWAAWMMSIEDEPKKTYWNAKF